MPLTGRLIYDSTRASAKLQALVYGIDAIESYTSTMP